MKDCVISENKGSIVAYIAADTYLCVNPYRDINKNPVKKNIRKRVCISWLLLATFTPFFVVKTLHHHEEEKTASSSCSDSHHSHRNADDCAICQFSLSLFTEASSCDFTIILPLIPYERVTTPDKIAFVLSYSHYLRAPPLGFD